MSLFLLGASHHTAPIDIRERFALTHQNQLEFYQHIKNTPNIKECVILNTCNRTEFYGVSDCVEMRPHLIKIFCEKNVIDPHLFDRHSFWMTQEKVIEHIFAVASGIDSQMIGETEILSQVKNSYQCALNLQLTGPLLNRIFQKTFQAAKWFRTHTHISRGQISIGNIAAELSTRVFGNLDSSNILVLGTGEVGHKTAQALKNRGAQNITVASRTLKNAQQMAETFEGSVIAFSQFQDLLHAFDIILCSTSSPEPLLTVPIVTQSLKKRHQQPFFLIDLAVPRNIETAVSKIPNIYLYNLDDLAEIANENLQMRNQEIQKYQQLLSQKAVYLYQKMNNSFAV